MVRGCTDLCVQGGKKRRGFKISSRGIIGWVIGVRERVPRHHVRSTLLLYVWQTVIYLHSSIPLSFITKHYNIVVVYPRSSSLFSISIV